MKPSVEEMLLAALVELEESVKSMPTSNPKPNLLALFARIDELAKQLPANIDPQLRHFLERKSYNKARLLLEEHAAQSTTGRHQ